MGITTRSVLAGLACLCVAVEGNCQEAVSVALPPGVRPVWEVGRAHRETTPTRERLCINGLWRWQPVRGRTGQVPTGGWGYLKVPGPWPGTQYWMHRESQTVYRHPSWQDLGLGAVDMAWYEREVTIPEAWAGRRIAVEAEYVNSYAAMYVDGKSVGEVQFPGGEVEITAACRPGDRHVLSLYVVALPLNEEIVSYAAADGASRASGRVLRRGLCGDVYLASAPAGCRITDVKVATSVRAWQITLDVALEDLAPERAYRLRARVMDEGREVERFDSRAFSAKDLQTGRFASTHDWHPAKLWDLHTPGNQYDVQVSLVDEDGKVLDEYRSVRFGFREFWIEGRDFMLNGTRLFVFAVPLDNAQISTVAASYAGAKESLLRLKSLGINLLYTHNYDCLPGSHLGFAEVLRAADDVGVLVSFSQPHVKDYDWKTPDADRSNGYARHAEYYVRRAQNHPSVVMYSMNHNMTGYSQDMNPDRIDGLYNPWPDPGGRSEERTDASAVLARRAQAIVERLDPTRVVYHHSSGNLGTMHTINCYLNFVPIQERSDWFEHWATEGVKPVFLCEYGVPLRMSWTLFRGWYEGRRYFTNGKVKYQFCPAEWGAQFRGDSAYQLAEGEEADLRFEAAQWWKGATWYRWDYPFQVVNTPALGVPNIDDVQAMYIKENWRAFRTWGVSAFNIWTLSNRWKVRDGVSDARVDLPVDWDNLQRPGFSPDFIEQPYQRFDTAYDVTDWIPTKSAEALIRNNQPLLAYIAGKPARFTSKDHIFCPGETVEKQIIIVNNSREKVTCDCAWRLGLPEAITGQQEVSIETGQQARVPLRLTLPGTLAPGEYELSMTATFASGETQSDTFALHVLPRPEPPRVTARIGLFDPVGETAALLRGLGVSYETVEAGADLSPYDLLVVGKAALTVAGPGPDLGRVREGLRVLMFEQRAEVMEKRLGFRVQEYGLRRLFRRVPDHPLLAGLDEEHLRDWRGEATILPARCDPGQEPNAVPSVRWCGITVTRPWRCGCQGNVASVLIEKPAAGDFLPVLDGGFGLQYSPLAVFSEGQGMVVFCQVDVTGRTEGEPAARRLVTNLLEYAVGYVPPQRRSVLYVGEPAGRAHLERAGLTPGTYDGGRITGEQVLVVAPGGGGGLARHREALAEGLESGARLVAVGLAGEEASGFLPFAVSTREAEHISAYFPPPGLGSPLAGVGPADVLNRDPRELPLVAGGAEPVGDGVLALGGAGKVVFCQMAPWRFGYEESFHLKMTFRRASFALTRVLANLGVSAQTPLLSRFAEPVVLPDAGASLVRNGDFSADADGKGAADEWQVSGSGRYESTREQMGDGWCQRMALLDLGEGDKGSVMLAQPDVPVKEGQWYRISLRARAEGLRGARLNLTLMNTADWRAFFEYQPFAPDEEWREFAFEVVSKGTADSKTRFQIWYGSLGTVWLADVRMVPIDPPQHGRWQSGLYLDQPEEMDDPYRFFRW